MRRRIQQRAGQWRRHHIERSPAGDGESDTRLFAAHATSIVERHMREIDDGSDPPDAVDPPRGAVRELGGLRTRQQLESHFAQRLDADIGGPMRSVEVTISAESKLFAPPYDLEWASGNGVASAGRFAGRLFTVPTANSFSAAGVGFYLTVNEPVLAAITPHGTCHFDWIALDDLPFARSTGGLGITVYTGAQAQPAVSHQPVLWSTSGMTTFSCQKGSGRLAEATLPVFGSGALPIAPAVLHLIPGSRTLVWVWCWQAAWLDDDDAFIAVLNLAMPFVTIDAGLPLANPGVP